MKVFETRTKPAKEYKTQVALICDLCRKSHPTYDDNWLPGHNLFEETEVSISNGYTCPSGGERESKKYHVCPPCFKNVLEPFLQSLGAQPSDECDDW